jgi:integrase/recombinase XerD
MLTIYRRHQKDCKHRRDGRKYRRCECIIWVDGVLEGEEIRESLRQRNWQRAQETIRKWETEGRRTSRTERKTLVDAWQEFLADVDARKLHDSTIRKYKLLNRQMDAYAQRVGFRFLAEFDLSAVSQFRSTWKDGQRSSAKKLERLRAFFRFAQKRKWISENPATDLKAPKVTLCPTLPYDHQEMMRILAAAEQYKEVTPRHGKDNARRIRALVLVQRYGGMRIGDAVNLSMTKLNRNRLFLYQQKTGVAVYVVLPDFVVKALETTPRVSDTHFFWSGKGKLDSAVRSWETRLSKLFKLAKVPDGKSHRFRDTFSVELLLAGVPLERVSILLGHQSVRITEKHYAPWVRSRQEQLEADLTKAWSKDPLIAFETKGTSEVHGKSGHAN